MPIIKKEKIAFSSLLNYGFLAVPLAFAGFPLYVLAPDFYATKYAIKLSTLGIVLLALRLFDAIQDPLIGIISDRYRSYTIFIMLLSAITLVLSIYSLFNLSSFSPLIWFIVCMSFAVTSYSILAINLNALGALWTKEGKEQSTISATREGFGLIGLVLAVSLPNLLAQVVLNDQVYQWFGLTLAILMVLAFWKFFRWYNLNGKKLNKKVQFSFQHFIKAFSVESKKLVLIYIISMVASSIPAVLVIFFVRDLLKAEMYLGLFLLFYFLSGVCFIPFWNFMSKKYGKYQSWFIAMLVASCSFIWAFLLKEGDLWQYIVVCITSGSALGADLLFPPAILADQLHAAKAEGSASTYYGVLTLTSKVSLALASALSFPILEIMGFIPAGKNSENSLMGLSISYALVPCIIKIGSAFLLWYIFIKAGKGKFHENN